MRQFIFTSLKKVQIERSWYTGRASICRFKLKDVGVLWVVVVVWGWQTMFVTLITDSGDACHVSHVPAPICHWSTPHQHRPHEPSLTTIALDINWWTNNSASLIIINTWKTGNGKCLMLSDCWLWSMSSRQSLSCASLSSFHTHKHTTEWHHFVNIKCLHCLLCLLNMKNIFHQSTKNIWYLQLKVTEDDQPIMLHQLRSSLCHMRWIWLRRRWTWEAGGGGRMSGVGRGNGLHWEYVWCGRDQERLAGDNPTFDCCCHWRITGTSFANICQYYYVTDTVQLYRSRLHC